MTSKELVIDLLRKQKERESTAGPESIQGRVEEWNHSVESLLSRIREWLRDAEAAGLLTVDMIPVEVREERLGTYQSSGLKLSMPAGVSVRIAPKAREVVGATGRVDFEALPKKAILLRRDGDSWHFAESNPQRGGWSFRDLTEDSFWETLRTLIA